MNDFIVSALAFIVALGILVTVHEFGHFWVAKRLGVKVLRFSVGFGKALWSRISANGETEYVIAAIPLGGYVKMLDETEGEVEDSEKHRAFNRQAIWRRTLIVLAGPMANFLFAIFAYWLVFMIGIDGVRPIVGEVVAESAAAKSGIKAGDEIISIDGRPNQTWREHNLHLIDKALNGSVITLQTRDVSDRVNLHKFDLSALQSGQASLLLLENGLGLRGFIPKFPAIIGRVMEGSPGANGGIIVGDEIVELDGKAIDGWRDLVVWVRQRPGQEISIGTIRNGKKELLTVTTDTITTESGQKIGRIGIEPKQVEISIPEELQVTLRYGPLEGVWRGIESTWVMSVVTVKMLYKMLQRKVSTDNISGPITIARYAGTSVQSGIDRFILFLAVVSISLGILNLLPIPVLDGGHLLYYLIEIITRKPVSEQVMVWGQQIGILMIVALMGLAFYNDIIGLLR